MRRGFLPQKPVTIINENGDDAATEAAMQAATKAQATADNARQMVLNRDPRLTTLEEVAQTVRDALTASDDIHNDLRNEIANIELTPGPKGDTGATGAKGDTGAAGTPRTIAIGTGRFTAALILGGTVDITVTLSRTMPNTTYNVDIAPTPGMTFTVKTRTATTVTITVTATLALAIGATFTLTAWA